MTAKEKEWNEAVDGIDKIHRKCQSIVVRELTCKECGEFALLPQHHRISCSHWDVIPEPDAL